MIARDAALIDAALTVQRWRRRFHPRSTWELRMRRHIGRAMGCERTWNAIEDAIVLLLLAEDDAPVRLAA
jgi:hypothetical protein